MTIGGLALGALGASLFIILLNYVIQPQMSVETRDIYVINGERFDVWYHEGSPLRSGFTELSARLEESLDDLMQRLDVEATEVPTPIDVLVHDDSRQLQSSIAQRKSPTGTHTFFAVIDLVGEEDPYPRLAELVLAFGWGECFSQLLYDGLLSTIVQPERNHHAALAAAPERLRYSFDDLVHLETAGRFELTIYQRFDSPFSASMALSSLEGIAAFYSVFAAGGDAIPKEDFASLQAASLVSYLVECNGGLGAVKPAWGPGSSLALFGRLACGAPDELTASWWDTAIAKGSASADYDYYRALYLFELGEFAEAHRLTLAWRERDLSQRELVLAVRSALSIGAFDEAASWMRGAKDAPDRLTDWIELFNGWQEFAKGGITILGAVSEAEADRLADEVRAASDRVAAALELSSDQLPQRMTIFTYETEDACRLGEGVTPDDGANRTAWHVIAGEDIGWTLASTLPTYAYGIASASNLLQTGLAAAVSSEFDELVADGCEILVAGNWTPLWQLGFGGVPSRLFRTQSGLMVRHLIDAYGLEIIPGLWRATARLGGGMSLDSAMLELAGTSRRDIERGLLNSVLVCD